MVPSSLRPPALGLPLSLSGDNMGTRYRPLVGHPVGVTGRGMGRHAPCQRGFTFGPHFNAKSPASRPGGHRRHATDVDRGTRRHGTPVDTQVGHAVPTVVRGGAVRVSPCESVACEVSTRATGRALCVRWVPRIAGPPTASAARRGPAQPA